MSCLLSTLPHAHYACTQAPNSREGFSWNIVRIILQTSQVGHYPEMKSYQPPIFEASGIGLIKADFILSKYCEKQFSSRSILWMLTVAIIPTPDLGTVPSTFKQNGLTSMLNQMRVLAPL